MTFIEKCTWAQALSILGCYGIYLAVVYSRMQGVPVTSVTYAIPVLITIGASIILAVLTSIAAAIVTRDRGTRDERDTTISHKGERVGNLVFSLGALIPLGLAMAEIEHFWIANALLLAFFVSSMTSTGVKLLIYRRGY